MNLTQHPKWPTLLIAARAMDIPLAEAVTAAPGDLALRREVESLKAAVAERDFRLGGLEALQATADAVGKRALLLQESLAKQEIATKVAAGVAERLRNERNQARQDLARALERLETAQQAQGEASARGPASGPPERPETAVAPAPGAPTKPAPTDDGYGVDPHYVPTAAAHRLRRYIHEGKAAYCVGPAGCGKTQAARWALREEGRPLVFLAGHGDLLADTLEGAGWLTTRDGALEMQWAQGHIELALRQGHVLLVDELDRMPVAVQHLLHDVTQSRSYTPRQGPGAGRRIPAAPGFGLVATGNTLEGSGGGYTATAFDKATLSRFRVVPFDFDPATERTVLEKLGLNGQTDTLLRAAAAIRQLHADNDLPVGVGTRELVHTARDILGGHTLREAWEANVALHQGEPGGTAYQRAMAVLKGGA